MDWHFRVHQRMTDAEKRGQHRSWYVDELVRCPLSPFPYPLPLTTPKQEPTNLTPSVPLTQDWIRTREAIDTDYVSPPTDLSSFSLDDPHATTTSSTNIHHHHNTTSLNPKSNTAAAAAAAAANRTPYIPVPEDSAAVNSTCPNCQEKFEMKWLDEAQVWVWTDAVRVGGGERVFHASCYREAYGALPERGVGVGMGVKRKAEVCSMSCRDGGLMGGALADLVM
jgi:pre-mRNA cleavage complex 2 protein Pcf11